MTIDDLDQTLQRLSQASERIGSNLLELELDPSHRMLDDARLTGASAKVWAAASQTLLQLWEWHGLLDANLDRARTLRGTRSNPRPDQIAGLEQLLAGETIELTTEAVPLARRDLLGTTQTTVRCSPDELLALMCTRFDQVKTVVARFAHSWQALEPRIREAGERLAEANLMAADQADAGPIELAAAAERLAWIRNQIATDPLAVCTEDVDRLEQTLAAATAELVRLKEFRRDVDRRLDRAGRLLNELRDAQCEADSAEAELQLKIAAPPCTPVTPRAPMPDLEAYLAQVVELCAAGAWRLAAETLVEWTQRTESLLNEAHRLAAASREPIEQRNRLRGLLDGYRAKTAGLGLLEDDELADVLRAAEDALYTAPTELSHAADLVASYSTLLDRRREIPA